MTQHDKGEGMGFEDRALLVARIMFEEFGNDCADRGFEREWGSLAKYERERWIGTARAALRALPPNEVPDP